MTNQSTASSEQSTPIFWPTMIIHILVHVGALFGFFTFSWTNLALAAVLYWATLCLGITLCFHRLLTHRSFTLVKPLEYLFAVLGTLALEGGPIMWVSYHRTHHAQSDTDQDPHSANRGFWWSHLGWVIFRHPESMSLNYYSRFAKDIASDPFYQFLDHALLPMQLLLAMILYVVGGWSFIVWGIFVRLVFALNATYFVNSACHIWGYRSHATDDRSTNLWWVALLTFGEGWHNNHHAFQYSARHGLRWWEVDITYVVIWLLVKLGLAHNLQLPKIQHQPQGAPRLL